MMEILSPPNLKPSIKNYWFMYGTEGAKQFFFMFGTAKMPLLKCNGNSGAYPDYAVVFWGYDPKHGKTVKMDTSMKLKFPFRKPFLYKQEGKNFVFEYDDTSLKFGKEYMPNARSRFKSFADINTEYRETKGKLFGRRFNGRAYFQKVETWAPFFPSWDWFRFHNKHVFDVFNVPGIHKPVASFDGKQFPVRVEADSGKLRVFSGELDLRTEPYEGYTVDFKWLLPRFMYRQHLVKVEGKVGKTKVSDYGMVEEARLRPW